MTNEVPDSLRVPGPTPGNVIFDKTIPHATKTASTINKRRIENEEIDEAVSLTGISALVRPNVESLNKDPINAVPLNDLVDNTTARVA